MAPRRKAAAMAEGHDDRLQEEEESIGRLISASLLPIELQLRVIASLPSALLFECRVLSRAVHALALRVLSRRPFLVLQVSPARCRLLPLDTPFTPLPCTFSIAKTSFQIVRASSNLLCLQRRYPSMLDISVCNILRKFKAVLPPIVHPDLAPRLLRRVFLEDRNVDSLDIIAFRAGMHSQGAQTLGNFSCNGPYAGDLSTEKKAVMAGDDNLEGDMFCIVVGNGEYMRMFEPHRNQWSDPIYFSPELKERNRPPCCHINPDGTLVLFSSRTTAVFVPQDVAFNFLAVDWPRCDFEVGDHPANVFLDKSNSILHVHLLEPYSIQESETSQYVKHKMAAPVKKSCLVPPQCGCGTRYRRIIHTSCHGYQNMVFAVVLDEDRLHHRLRYSRLEREGQFRINEMATIKIDDLMMMGKNQTHAAQVTGSFRTGSSAMEEQRISMPLPPKGQPPPMCMSRDSKAALHHLDQCPSGSHFTINTLTIHIGRIDNTHADIRKWNMDVATVDASDLLPQSDMSGNKFNVSFFFLGGLHK